jgi:ABC-type transport system involved in multi-copper enzyme maturation permease subunit
VKLGELLRSANRLQQSRMFKIVATCVVAVLAIAGVVGYTVAVHAKPPSLITAEPEPAPAPDAAGPSPTTPGAPKSIDKTVQIINGILAAKQDPLGVAVGITLGSALAIGVIWLGLGLTYLGLGVAAGLVTLAARFVGLSPGTAVLLVGTMALTASFAALMRLVGLALSAPLPVFAIARNVLNEAVRIKVSLVFILMLMFGLAKLPDWIGSEKEPLRYKVQNFLAYGTGGAFWLIAVLVLVFSVATVAFEQRDKTIWQTMTKPVAAWQYVLGKWLGVVALAGVLLAVSTSGVFLFTEYLRSQPAIGEKEAYVAEEGGSVSEDRFKLETEVLASREVRQASPLEFDPQQFSENIRLRTDQEIKQLQDAGEAVDPEREAIIRDKIIADLPKQVQTEFRSVAPGRGRDYKFEGLKDAREANGPIMLRFKVNAGANSPDSLYRLTFNIQNEGYRVVECPLGQMLSLRPPMLPDVVDANGVLRIAIYNYDSERGTINPETISFPPDGLEVSYAAGSYRANFARVVVVLWVKLAFLAMLAIVGSTFLSFPVACMVAFTTFIAAESSGFILKSLENYQTETREGKAIIFNTVVDRVASGVGHLFKIYEGLHPSGRLVDGLKLPWGDVSEGVLVLLIGTGILYILGVVVFRQRELATYSGH